MNLLQAAFGAPLVGVSKRWPKVLHAITMENVIRDWESNTTTAACGRSQLKILGTKNGYALPWPPLHRCAPDERCRPCWVATGKKRPRIKRKSDD